MLIYSEVLNKNIIEYVIFYGSEYVNDENVVETKRFYKLMVRDLILLFAFFFGSLNWLFSYYTFSIVTVDFLFTN